MAVIECYSDRLLGGGYSRTAIQRIVCQPYIDLVLRGEVHHALHELRAAAVILGAVVQVNHNWRALQNSIAEGRKLGVGRYHQDPIRLTHKPLHHLTPILQHPLIFPICS